MKNMKYTTHAMLSFTEIKIYAAWNFSVWKLLYLVRDIFSYSGDIIV